MTDSTSKRFRQAYIEITNKCNLACSFCPRTGRPPADMDAALFARIVEEVKPLTDTVYFHVMGEPLMHPDFTQFIQICADKALPVAITTNGTMLNIDSAKALLDPIVHRINFSLDALLPRELDDTNDNDMNHPSHYRINDISDNYNNNNSSSNNSIILNGNGIGNIGGSTSNNNSSHDECSINTNNNSSNHSSNSSIHRATDIRNSRNIVRSTNERDENNIIGNMKSGLRDDGSIAFTSIDISRSRFNNMTLHPSSSTSSPNPTTPS